MICKNQSANFQISFSLSEGGDAALPFFLRIHSELPVSLYYVNNVPVIHTSSLENAPRIGMYPDILLPKKVNAPVADFAYPWAGMLMEKSEDVLLRAYNDSWQAVWLTVNEGEGANLAEGIYPITVEAFSTKNERIASSSLRVRVLGHRLPRQKLIYTNWFHYDCLADLYREEVFSDRYFEIMKNYVETAAKNGMNMILMPTFTPPLDTGIGCERMTVQLVRITKNGREYSFDFSLLKRFIEICQRAGIRYFEHPHLFTQWGATSAPKIIVYENGRQRRAFGWDSPATGKRYVSFLRQYITSLRQFLSGLGLEKKVLFHISDEPEAPAHVESYRRAKESVADLLLGCMVGDTLSDVKIYEMGICDTPIAVTDKIRDFIGKSPNLWAYYTGLQSDKGKSNRLITVSRERNRMLGVQLYYFDIKGFLHWAYNNYYGPQSQYLFDPSKNPCGGFALAGTSYMVYPDFGGGCFQSVRQKIFAEGLGDMRLLALLERLRGRDFCHSLIRQHFGELDFDRGAESPETYNRFITDVYREIEKAQNG